MTAEELIDELAKDPQLQMPREKIAGNVRMGRAHGYPDCCIRAFMLAVPKPGQDAAETRTAEQISYARVAKRRLCPECEANVKEFATDPGCKREQNTEIAIADLRQELNGLHNARTYSPSDAKAEDAAWDKIRKAVDGYLKWRGRS